MLSTISSNEPPYKPPIPTYSCPVLPMDMYIYILLFLDPTDICILSFCSMMMKRIADQCWSILSSEPICNYATFLSRPAIPLSRRVNYAYGSPSSASPNGIVIMNNFNTSFPMPVKMTGPPQASHLELIKNSLPGYVDSRTGCILSTSLSDILLFGGYDHPGAGAVRDILCFNACTGAHYRIEQVLPEVTCFSSCTRMIDGGIVLTGAVLFYIYISVYIIFVLHVC
jgi:hypothetical protein